VRGVSRSSVGLPQECRSPQTAAFIGFLAIVGCPPRTVFSEFVLFQGAFIRATNTPTIFRISIAVLGVVATALTAGYSSGRCVESFSVPRTSTRQLYRAPLTVTIPLIVLSVVTILLGIYPEPVLGGLFNAARAIPILGGI